MRPCLKFDEQFAQDLQANMDHFRYDSDAFKSLPWRTNILYTPLGVEKVEHIPALSVSPPICLMT
jgi:hypothetical protein